MYFENVGEGKFIGHALPDKLQLSSIRAALLIQDDPEKPVRLFVAGNFHENHIDMGWYNANYGSVLTIGKNNSLMVDDASLNIRGQVREIKPLKIRGRMVYVFVRNNDSVKLLTNTDALEINQ